MKYFLFTSCPFYFILFLTLISFSSCEKNEIITENNAITSDEFIEDIVIAITNKEYDMAVGGDMGAVWSQQIAKIQYIDESPKESEIQSIWDVFYEDVVFKSKEMDDLATVEGNNNLRAISLVLKAYGFSRLTDLFGDIPFIDESTSTPAYALQEDIYPQIFEMLNTAILLFNSSDLVDGSHDILYNGDTDKWLKFANSLKFRCLMRVSNVMSVETELQELINTNNLFQSIDDEAKRQFLGVFPDMNPIHIAIVENNRNEWKANNQLVDRQVPNNDPRTITMFSLNDEGVYRGTWTGGNEPPNSVSNIGENYLDSSLPAYLLSFSELEFLKAEAAQKGYISGNASDYYNSGINASFTVNGVSDNGYIASNELFDVTALQQIAIEKWIALYIQGLESWIELRRTGYPSVNGLHSNPYYGLPNRLTYPISESINNAVNYNNAISSQGPDELSTLMWWME